MYFVHRTHLIQVLNVIIHNLQLSCSHNNKKTIIILYTSYSRINLKTWVMENRWKTSLCQWHPEICVNLFRYDNIPLHLPGDPTVYTAVRWEKSVTNMKLSGSFWINISRHPTMPKMLFSKIQIYEFKDLIRNKKQPKT